MNDMSQIIEPKSDQLNADDLIAGPRTITITRVEARPRTEQPVSIHFEGDNGKPYKPCKSMCRVMVHAWGLRHTNWIGKSMTLYRDPSVKWGGLEVGGIRISHMSDIGEQRTMALTVTRGSRKPFTVKPLATAAGAGDVSSPHPAKREALGAEPPATEQTSPPASPPPDAGEGAGAPVAPGAPAFTFTMTNSKGEAFTTTDGAKWRDALLKLIETKPFDQVQRTWEANKGHVEAAYNAGQADYAIKIEAAWKRRERAAADTGRAG